MGTNGDRRRLRVGIVGGGFGGVGMGIKLKERGDAAFTIFERGETVGGVWRANTYPGAACDVPSHLYSFSFAPGSDWSRRYAPREDILAYLEGLVDRYGLGPHLRLGTEATAAAFDPEAGAWNLSVDDGTEHEFDVLVTACGQLATPAIPEIEGADRFEGPAFHSAEWDHDLDLNGKRVAVLGTGASAIQFVPEIAGVAGHVDIYQRSAPWILPKSDREYPDWERNLFRRFPARVAAARLGMFAFFEGGTYGFTGHPWVLAPFRAIADRERQKQLSGHPELLEKATPDHEIGCKRILFTSDWYPTLTRENVDLHQGDVERITSSGVVGPDGTEREADMLIWGTGFRSRDFVAPMEITGLDGRDLTETWADRPEAYLGTTVTGFPNLFVLYGPNTNHGSGSVPYTLECQYSYVLDALRRLREGGFRYLELRPETQEAWRREMEERSADTAWVTGGGHNWYVNEQGVNTNNWPGAWLEFRRRTKRINPGDYRVAA